MPRTMEVFLPATPYRRFTAYWIDVNVAFLLAASVVYAAKMLTLQVFHFHPSIRHHVFADYNELLNPLVFLFLAGYFCYANYFAQGRSLGCICLNFSIISQNDQPMTWPKALTRGLVQTLYLAVTFTIVLIPLLLIPLLRKDRRGLADLLSATRSLRDDSKLEAILPFNVPPLPPAILDKIAAQNMTQPPEQPRGKIAEEGIFPFNVPPIPQAALQQAKTHLTPRGVNRRKGTRRTGAKICRIIV